MYDGPHITLHYDPAALIEAGTGPFLMMEALVPGVITWTKTPGSGKGVMKALRNRLPQSHGQGYASSGYASAGFAALQTRLDNIVQVWQTVPAHAAHLMGNLPPECQALSKWMTARVDHMAGFRWLPKIKDEASLESQVAAGREAINRMVDAGYILPDRAAKVSARWYQALLPVVTVGRPGLLLRADGGTGKSIGSLITSLACGATRILILCPAEVRDPYLGWPAEIREWLTIPPFVFLPPKSPLRAKAEWPDAASYVAFRGDKPAIGVCAYNNIADHMAEIESFQPDFVVIDEIDKVGKNSKRFRRVVVNGVIDYEKTTTEMLGKTSRAAGIHEVCHLRSVKTRFGMSATDIDTGDPEDIYGVISLLDDGFGRKFDFLSRYKSGPPLEAKDPRFAERSPSNLGELRGRLMALRLDIPASVTDRFIPACDAKMIRLPVEVQGSGRGLGLALEARQAAAKGDRLAGFELETAMAAMAKKPYVVEKVSARLLRGQRCVAYATRIGVVEHLFEAIINATVKSLTLAGQPGGLPELPADAPVQNHPVAQLAALHGVWAACLHSGDETYPGAPNKGLLVAAYRDLPLGIPAFIFGVRDSISRGINGLQETHYACYVQLGRTAGPVLQAIYRHRRPKKRLGMVPTDFEILAADHTIDDTIREEGLRLLVAALAVAPSEGLQGLMDTMHAAGKMDVDALAARFDAPGISDNERRKILDEANMADFDFGGAGGLGGYDDDEDVPF